MTRIEHGASLHPSTVTAFSQSQQRVQRRVASSRREAIRTSSVVVHPLVWQLALDRCCGDPQRIEVISSTEVRIHNDASWRDAR